MTDIYDLIIIGGGPAGITAGIYAARKKLKTLIISKDFQGQVKFAISIENYPGLQGITGIELAQKFEEHLKQQEIEMINGEAVKIKKENQIDENFKELMKLFKNNPDLIAKTLENLKKDIV